MSRRESLSKYSELYNYIRSYKDVPNQLTLTGKQLNNPVQVVYKSNPSSLKTDCLTNAYIEGYVESVTNEFELLKNKTLKNMISYTTKALNTHVKEEMVKCIITASIDKQNMKLGDILNIELTVPCLNHGAIDLVKIFESPIHVLVPLAEFIDELELQSSSFNLTRVNARMQITRDNLDYIFEQPIYDVHKETATQWLNVFNVAYGIIKGFHGTVLSIPCVNGQLEHPQPIETRASHSYFEGFEDCVNKRKNINKVAVYQIPNDKKVGD